MNANAMEVFKNAFSQTSGVSIASYSMSIRFLAAILICISGVLAISYFMNTSHKESDTFTVDFVAFWVKVFLGICLSLLFLIY